MKNRTSSLYLVVSVSIVVALLVVILGAFAGGLILAPYLLDNAQAAPVPQAASISEQATPLSVDDTDLVAAYEQTLIDVYQSTVPSVVSLRVTKSVDTRSPHGFGSPPFFRSPHPPLPEGFLNQGQGSGFVWDKAGHILTNYHVVANATDVEVVFVDGETVKAEVIGTDPDSDLAVIKVDRPASALQPVALGDSDNLQVGQMAIAIGSPFGQESTMTNGIISAVGRTIRNGNTPFAIPEVIQTDAPINPGNSGGPLLNRQGEVIGINSQIISRSGASAGIGFAVPINIAKQVAPALIKGETYEYSWLGITGRTLRAEDVDSMGLPVETDGVLVLTVVKDGPADEAGLQGGDKISSADDEELQFGGDVITAIEGQPVIDMDDLTTYLVGETQPGDKVELDVVRNDGDQETITITLGKRPAVDAIDQDN